MATLEEQFLSQVQQRGLQARDIRFTLPSAGWAIGDAEAKTSRTVHYNGPALPAHRQSGAGVMDQLVADVNWHMGAGHGFGNGADGLQYHIVIDAAGVVYLCRNLIRELWHCGNPSGNRYSVAIHFPLGGAQEATAAQWAAFRIVDAILFALGIGGEDDVYAHNEWAGANTQCPGALVDDLIAHRANNGQAAVDVAQGWTRRSQYRMTTNDVNVRRGPYTTDATFAHFDMDDGPIWVDRKVQGTRVQPDPTSATVIDLWGRVLAGQGFPGDGGYFSFAFAELVQRPFIAKTNAKIRAKTNADASTPLVNVPEYGGNVIPVGKPLTIVEELIGKVPPGYTSPVWYRLSGRTVYVYSELVEELR